MIANIKTKFRIAMLVVALALLASVASLRAQNIFTFAGHTFDQRYTPTTGTLLGNGAQLGDAKFSTNLPNAVTSTINFPQSGSGFDTSRSLAQLTSLGTGMRAVNLPRGNNAGNAVATNRHGIQVSWNNGRVLANLPGKDFVVFESGSSASGVEGVMARVRTNSVPEGWTHWYYFAPTSYQHTTNAEVAFAISFDLSEMGVDETGRTDRIQIANLTEYDRIETTNAVDLGGGVFVGQGKVLFDSLSNVSPDAGPFDTDRRYSTDAHDPDPFYIAALHPVCEATAPKLGITRIGFDLRLSWPAPSCYTLEWCSTFSDGTIVWTPATEAVLVTNGTNEILVANNGATQFFRLVK